MNHKKNTHIVDFSEITDFITAVNTKLHKILIMYEFASGIPNDVSSNIFVDLKRVKGEAVNGVEPDGEREIYPRSALLLI